MNGTCSVILTSVVTHCGGRVNFSICLVANSSRRNRGVRRGTGTRNVSPGTCISETTSAVGTI